jgi:hypothetical protein
MARLGEAKTAGEQLEAAHQIYTRLGAGTLWLAAIEADRTAFSASNALR